MNRHLLFIAISIIAPSPALAMYIPLTFAELAADSDRILVGAIVKVDEDTVDVTIEEVIAGPGRPQDTIVVVKFRDWPCAWRWEKYAVGQKLVMFLRTTKEQPDRNQIRGAGGEGESPFVDGKVDPRFGIPGLIEQYGRIHVRYDNLRAAILEVRGAPVGKRVATLWQMKGDDAVYPPRDHVEGNSSSGPTGFKKRYPPGAKRAGVQ